MDNMDTLEVLYAKKKLRIDQRWMLGTITTIESIKQTNSDIVTVGYGNNNIEIRFIVLYI